MIRILAVGYNAFDVIFPVGDRRLPDGKIEVAGIHHGGGGPAATAAVALSRLGARVRLVTVLTDDLPGEIQRRELEEAGVDISLSPVRRGCRSAQAVSLVDVETRERTIFWSRGDLPFLDLAEVNPAWLDGADLLYCDGHEPAAATLLAAEARRRGMPVVMDAGTPREGTRELVSRCSDVISSRDFAPTLTGKDQPAAALAALSLLGPERVAMTFGRAGCLALDAGNCFHIPAFDVPVVDTTGAGDAFHAGYAYARAENRPWRASLVFASAVAALKCRDWGGRRGLPDLKEVEALIREGRPRPDRPGELEAPGHGVVDADRGPG